MFRFAGDGEHVGRATVPGGANLSFRRHRARHAALRVLGEELSEEQCDARVLLQPGDAHLGTAVHCTPVPGNLKPRTNKTSIPKQGHQRPYKRNEIYSYFQTRKSSCMKTQEAYRPRLTLSMGFPAHGAGGWGKGETVLVLAGGGAGSGCTLSWCWPGWGWEGKGYPVVSLPRGWGWVGKWYLPIILRTRAVKRDKDWKKSISLFIIEFSEFVPDVWVVRLWSWPWRQAVLWPLLQRRWDTPKAQHCSGAQWGSEGGSQRWASSPGKLQFLQWIHWVILLEEKVLNKTQSYNFLEFWCHSQLRLIVM